MEQVLNQDPDQLRQFKQKSSKAKSARNKPNKIELLIDLAKFLPTGDSIKSVIGNKVQDIAQLKKPKSPVIEPVVEPVVEEPNTSSYVPFVEEEPKYSPTGSPPLERPQEFFIDLEQGFSRNFRES